MKDNALVRRDDPNYAVSVTNMENDEKKKKKFWPYLVLMTLTIILIAGTAYLHNPVRRVKSLLAVGDVDGTVTFYNEHQLSANNKQEIEQLISENLQNAIVGWKEDHNYGKYGKTFDGFSRIMSEAIAQQAQGYLDLATVYDLISEKKYADARSYYDEHSIGVEYRIEIESLFIKTVDSLFADWKEGSITAEECSNGLSVFVDFTVASIAQTAKDDLDYVSLYELLKAEKYEELATYYNDHCLNISTKNEIDESLNEAIDSIKLDWSEETITADVAEEKLKAISGINDAVIAGKAEEIQRFIRVEELGNKSLSEATEAYKNKEYLQAMKSIAIAPKGYSQYDALHNLYTGCRIILMNDVGTPETVEEYEAAVKLLGTYISEVSDPEFIQKRNTLNNELREYRDIYNILISATDLYEKGSYGESFATLEQGIEKHPDNEKISYALSAYQYAFILTVSGQVIDYAERKDYDSAQKLLEKSMEEYDCEEFRELLKEVRMKSDFLYAASVKLSDTGDYVYRSGRKMVLGDFAEDEKETLLSLGGSVAASIANVDAPLDIRDLAYDMSHWGEGDYFAARLALDAVGILPVIGAIKYIKHLDTVADVAKAADKATDIADTAHDVAKTADAAHDLKNAADAADTVHDAAKAVDAAEDISDALKQSDNLVDMADVVSDVRKKADVVGDLSDVAKEADDVADAAKKVDKVDDIANVAKRTDTIQDMADNTADYIPIITRNQSLLGDKHPITGVEFVQSKIDLSDGSKLIGVFPKFDSKVDIQLPVEYYKESFEVQKVYLADALKKMAEDPEELKTLQKTFSADEIDDILKGVIPEGFIWHHNEQEGLMQLVDEATHEATGHTGGMSIWGIGY